MLTCRLRVRADEQGRLPPILCWPMLLDRNRFHVLLRGWTLLHMTAEPGNEHDRWRLSGRAVVLDAPDFTAALRASGLGNIDDVASAEEVKKGDIVVVPGAPNHATTAALQSAFFESECPLVVWCGASIPAVGHGLLEVVSTGEPHPETERASEWVGRLIRNMQTGDAPEDALARALKHSHEGALNAWLLRGVLRPLEHPPDTRNWREHLLHWRHEIDRSAQSNDLEFHAKNLLTVKTRRIHVVLVAAEERAGLSYFRGRPVLPPGDGVSYVLTQREPEWARAPRETLDRVRASFGAGEGPSLATKLRRFSGQGRRAFIRINHPIVELGDRRGRTVTVEDLRGYIAALRDLATQLDDAVRVLVTIFVSTPLPTEFSIGEFEDDDALPAELSVDMLPAIVTKVPVVEILGFLNGKEIGMTDEEFSDRKTRSARLKDLAKRLAAMDYDAMIAFLNQRFPKDLK